MIYLIKRNIGLLMIIAKYEPVFLLAREPQTQL